MHQPTMGLEPPLDFRRLLRNAYHPNAPPDFAQCRCHDSNDRAIFWRMSVFNGRVLLDSSFSNNPKVDAEGSYQNYPKAGSLPQSGAASKNTLGYYFFGDSIYHLEFIFPHSKSELKVDFTSSLFEDKGTEDESWGLNNVAVSTSTLPPPE
jgi:hypothetical protein